MTDTPAPPHTVPHATAFLARRANSTPRPALPDVIAHIAGFMTSHDVLASPPGLHPAPSGPAALWEILVLDIVRARAAEMIQQEWRKKIERAVARALAQAARLRM